ncbi:MAG: ABC transporter ATP-binding protein/permease [Desulfuromonadales bacterium]|jgi:ATP-binding cassette subfamily C protein|nr:ABC transporter ATP-binding protein/permease [Desulfuromonadales bacterium]MDH4024618.1 ABC transporter ATP-binding protein/permease [Desulfuromonadales bacterium]
MMLFALIMAGVVEGIGLTALLPLLQKAIDLPKGSSTENLSSSGADSFITSALSYVGISATVGSLLTVIMIGAILRSLLILIANRKVGYTVAHVATDLRLALLRALLSTRWGYFLGQQVGSMANAAGTEVMRASSAYLHAATALAMAIQAFAYFVVAMLVSWKITLLFMSVATLVLVLLYKMVSKAKRAGRKQTKLLQSLLARLSDSLQSLKAFKAMGRENLADELLSTNTMKLNKALRKQVLSKAVLRGIQEPLLTLLVIVGLYLMLVYLKMDLPKVMVLIFLMARMLNETGKVQRKYQDVAICESAYWSLQEKINKAQQHNEPQGGDKKATLEHGITIDHVYFGYGEQMILRNASLEIPGKTFTSIVGPSGAGKTTLVDLITGLFHPEKGTVRIDGTPLPELDLRSWRRMIGYVPQDTILLHDSIFINVTLGEELLTGEDVEYALKSAGAWDFVSEMAEGMQTTVGERGAKLSGGQRQRIAIARALIHRPHLLILDEATSALDPDTEAAICQTLKELRGQLTILAISHQAALVDVADRVFQISSGEIKLVTDHSKIKEASIDMDHLR